MKRATWRWVAPVVILAIHPASFAQLISVTGSAETKVTQYTGADAVQTDFGQEIVPTTKATPPATGRARLDRFSHLGNITAAGQGVAVMYAPNTTGVGLPSDIGMEIGSFSDNTDTQTGWVVNGTVRQTRTLQVAASDAGGPIPTTNNVRARSRLVLSGAMLLFSEDKLRDLTGNAIRFRFHIDRRQAGQDPLRALDGSVALVGGPGGTVNVVERTGALDTISLQVIDLRDQIPELPLVQAILFQGASFDYEYDVTPGEPFELELIANADVQTIPGGIGGQAVFGIPQEGLGAIFERVKQDDLGWQLAQLISQFVDTTGAAYVNQPPAIPNFFAICAPGTPLTMGVVAASLLAGVKVRRRRILRRSRR